MIQVTQRTQYHEVAAKVNIVHRPNVGPTHIHNYASGIGLSFLDLPRHIQAAVNKGREREGK
jgi:hypothetical protein